MLSNIDIHYNKKLIFELNRKMQSDSIDIYYLDLKGKFRMKENILVSACLLGVNCRYDGRNNYIPEMEQLKERYNLIPVCAEIYGGLTIPRLPSERKGNKVIDEEGQDVTSQFQKGAEEVLYLADFYQCKYALLKENSPTCGYGKIYDGSFRRILTEGNGILADKLEERGINIIGESRVKELF